MFICDKLMMVEPNADSSLIDLKTARENSGLTLKELFERTRISVVNLEAIENGDFHLLPVPIYARNFIKTYSDALGIDSKPVLQCYENYLQALQVKEKARATEQPTNSPLASIMNRYKAYLWIICIILIFAAVSFFVSLYNKPDPARLQNPEVKKEATIPETNAQNIGLPENFVAAVTEQKQETVVAEKKIAEEEKQATQKTTGTPPQSAASSATATKNDSSKLETMIDNEESSVLVVRTTEETWIRIKADDKESFQVLLKPGEKISHKGARFDMDIGNAGGVKMQFNGKNFDNLGKSGQVIHLRLP
jgi:cytoskeletal protein RodZ